jgi:putative addiction module antidote protein, CC2985 family
VVCFVDERRIMARDDDRFADVACSRRWPMTRSARSRSRLAVGTDDKLCHQRYDDDMATMNVSLPDALKEFVEAQVSGRGYGTSSEFVRDLIRREQARDRLHTLVVEGMASGPGSELDESYFEQLRDRIRTTADDAA